MSANSSKVQEVERLRAQGEARLKRLRHTSKPRALQELKAMDPTLFEYLVGALFERRGYQATTVGATGDEGVDVFLQRRFRKAVVQCKRYSGSVGQPVVRDLFGTMLHNGADEAYLVATGTVTKQAREWAEDKPIQLVDGYQLIEWIVESDGRTGRLTRPALLVAFCLALGMAGAFIYVRGLRSPGYGSFFSELPASLPAISPAVTLTFAPGRSDPTAAGTGASSTRVPPSQPGAAPAPTDVRFRRAYLSVVISTQRLASRPGPAGRGYPAPSRDRVVILRGASD